LHKACRRDGKGHQQRRPAHSPPRKRASFVRITMVVMVMMTVVMPAMAVIVAGVVIVVVMIVSRRRLAQWAAPG
jgi:hypothetical protein